MIALVCLCAITFIIWLLNKYAAAFIPVVSLVASFPLICYVFDIVRQYEIFVEQKKYMSDPNNLTVYINGISDMKKKIKTYQVFKKSNFSVNKYYWSIKTRDKDFYYTDSKNTENGMLTLNKILQTTKISGWRYKLVDDFFEYCLISHLLNEDETLMSDLSCGKEINIDGTILKSHDYFELGNNPNELSEIDECSQSNKTPDIVIENGQSKCVVDAYNGTSHKEIRRKLLMYKTAFKTSDVYVISSGVSDMKQLTASQGMKFSLWSLSTEDKAVEVTESIVCGAVAIDIKVINEKYRSEYKFFLSEIFYWQLCEKEQRIIQSLSDEDFWEEIRLC